MLRRLRLLLFGGLRLLVLDTPWFMLDVLVLEQQEAPLTSLLTPDIPPKFETPTTADDYVKRVVMIPMRDGVKLYTVIVLPKGFRSAPILLTRTPYNAASRASRNKSPYMLATLPLFDEVFVADGYI